MLEELTAALEEGSCVGLEEGWRPFQQAADRQMYYKLRADSPSLQHLPCPFNMTHRQNIQFYCAYPLEEPHILHH